MSLVNLAVDTAEALARQLKLYGLTRSSNERRVLVFNYDVSFRASSRAKDWRNIISLMIADDHSTAIASSTIATASASVPMAGPHGSSSPTTE